MYEKRVKKISRVIGEESKEKYFILTHKKYKREVYFQNERSAIEFLKVKFDPSLKKYKTIKNVIYFLIRIRLLQPFLKKIELSNKFGDVIFVGGQVKGFDLKNKVVYSYPVFREYYKDFKLEKKAQKKFAEMGFAPKITEYEGEIPSTKEELLKEYKSGNDIGVFRKLISFYKEIGISKISIKDFIKIPKRNFEKTGIKDEEITQLIEKLSKDNRKIFVTRTHGDFARGQVLIKNESYLFTDWNCEEDIMRKNIIVEDLVQFFGNANLTENENFKKILKLYYPKEVSENIKLYLLLNNLSMDIIRKGNHIRGERIEKKNL